MTVRRPRTSVATTFDPRDNSLNLVRLLLAALVVVSHAWPLGGFGVDPSLGHSSLGGYAIIGFFGLSGYLITDSGLKYGSGRFLWHRFLRIFPGYWVSIVLVAVVAVPLAAALRPGTAYPLADSAGYVARNFFLVQVQPDIGDSLAASPSGLGAWNGAVWTLAFEFVCYLGVALLAATRLLRPRVLLGLALLATTAWLVVTVAPSALPAVATSYWPTTVLLTGSIFLGGSLVRLFRDRVPLSVPVALAAGLGVVALQLVPAAPPVLIGLGATVALLWVGATVPAVSLLNRHDLSYGLYIYAFPVGQLLALTGVARGSVWLFLGMNLVVALTFGLASWQLIESRAMRAKSAPLPSRRGRRYAAPPAPTAGAARS